MFAVMGATGQVGGTVVDTLAAMGKSSRAIARDHAKIEHRHKNHCDVEAFAADASDAAALTQAFAGADGVFVMDPPNYRALDMFAESAATVAAIRAALEKGGWPPTVMLSSVGAHRTHGQGNIATVSHMETAFADHPQLTVVRAAWFMENWATPLARGRETGVMSSFLTPLERALPMVSAADIGRVCAEALADRFGGRRQIELHGPADYAPIDVAASAAHVLGGQIGIDPVPRATWPQVLGDMGFTSRTIEGWSEMLDGFNSGWMTFEDGDGVEVRYGAVTLDQAVARMLGHA